MITTSTFLVGTLALIVPAADAVSSAVPSGPTNGTIETRIWLDRGVDPVLQPGDQARIYYRASRDSYIAIFHIDTDGIARLLLPGDPENPSSVEGGQDYRLLLPGGEGSWIVEERPGVGYFFAVASEEPFDFEQLARSAGMAGPEDLTRFGTRAYQDPHVTLDAAIDALQTRHPDSGFALDFTAYHVGEAYSYPRFLCYACHAPEPFESWNPYHRTCRGYRVVIHNDPYYYPASRYSGDRAVYPRPPERGLPQFAFEERSPGESGMPLVVNRSRASGDAVPTRVLRNDASPPVLDTLPSLGSNPAAGVPTMTSPPGDEPVRNRPVLQRRPPR